MSSGLTMKQVDKMTLGMVLDFILAKNKRLKPKKELPYRKATQKDIDRIFG